MKKFTATMMVLVILTMSLVMAHAEGSEDIRAWSVETKEDGKVVYYITSKADSGAYVKTEVPQSVFEEAVIELHARKQEERRQQEIREYQSNRGSWVKDALAWCSFWNPND